MSVDPVCPQPNVSARARGGAARTESRAVHAAREAAREPTASRRDVKNIAIIIIIIIIFIIIITIIIIIIMIMFVCSYH